jgi:DNA polymerase
MACPWHSVCPLRRLEREGQLPDSWARDYCKTTDNWRRCRRYQLEEQGIPHSDYMLPNGQIDERGERE